MISHYGSILEDYDNKIDEEGQVTTQWFAIVREQRQYSLEYRFQKCDGTVKWVLRQATSESGYTGELVSYVGTIQQVQNNPENTGTTQP